MAADVLIMILGQFSASISIFLIRSSMLSPGFLATYRLFLTVVIILPVFLRDARKMRTELAGQKLPRIQVEPEDKKAEVKKFNQKSAQASWGRVLLHLAQHSIFPGIMLGVHFLFWNTAATMTLAANASLLVNMVPLFMPIIMFIMIAEKPRWQELAATAIAIAGVILLTFGDISLSGEYLLGDFYAFVAMLFVAVYLALARKNMHLPFWYYITGVYFFGAITALIASLLQGQAIWSERGWLELLPLLGLALIPTLLGHNLINRAMRRIPSQIVSIGQLSQVLWAGLLAWILYGEVPQKQFYPAVLLIALGVVIVICAHKDGSMQLEQSRPVHSQKPTMKDAHNANSLT